MSTTTQILFNSPALHSLKRDQLVKLCKIHSLKANGKNVEIIQRLRAHAQTLPRDSPLSIAARSEENCQVSQSNQTEVEVAQDDESDIHNPRPRPSEQWEVVMDDIEECDEDSSQGTLSSQRTVNNGATGEFGTGSSKSTTVSSSIRALATSLGLKRTTSKPTSESTSSRSTNNSQFPQPQSNPFVSSDDYLAQHSKPYASLPEPTTLPQTDHFTLGNETGQTVDFDGSPLPGHALRPGIPAPVNARLSLGLGLGVPATPTRKTQPTTTIRLVSNPLAPQDGFDVDMSGAGENGTPLLKPFQTDFAISFGSPIASNPNPFNFGFGSLNTWPPKNDDDDVEMTGIYPKLTFSDLPPSVVTSPAQLPVSVIQPTSPVPGSLAPPSPASPTFLFGSPRHSVSNAQFKSAAASVLEEMNARLRAEGVDEISTAIVDKLHPDRKVAPLEARDIKPLPNAGGRGEIRSQFDKLHMEEFSKMEGIDSALKRKQERTQRLSPQKAEEKETERVVGMKRKSSVMDGDAGPRRPSAIAPKSRGSTTRVISAGRRAKVLPGGFGMDEEDEEDGEDVNIEEQSRAGKRVRLDPEDQNTLAEQRQKDEEEGQRVKKEKEMKKKADAIRAARRSSAAGRASIGGARRSVGGPGARKSVGRGGPRASMLAKQKPKPARFGFLSSAKTLVQSVWNRGKTPVTGPGTATTSHIPKPTSTAAGSTGGATANNATKEPTPSPKEEKKLDKDKGKMKMVSQPAPSAIAHKKKASLVPAKATASSANSRTSIRSSNVNAKPGSSTTTANAETAVGSTRSRSPLPSFGTMSSIASSSSGSGTSKTSRVSSVAGTGAKARNLGGVSSVGTRLSVASRVSGGGAVGSMGAKKAILGSASSRTSAGISGSTRASRGSTGTSRLLAPTASSLAKGAKRTSVAGSSIPSPTFSKTKAKETAGVPEKPTLSSITNSPTVRNPLANPPTPGKAFSPGGIFTRPLLLPGQSGIPTPVKKRSTPPVSEDGVQAPVPAPTGSDLLTSPTITTKPRSLNGRKPRISRSKVIARLASQREASTSSSARTSASGSVTGTGVLKPRASGGRTRSSLGAKATRASYGGVGGAIKGRSSGGVGVAMSAKRRARQSEYMRRKSGRGTSVGVAGVDDNAREIESAMEVDTSS
ncbi:hypothetical protein CPB83DRAFT_859806 [Crepidotus variabilis]|uniref:SAP domain-containing protein n=1 Tax=Crepidotus variabilis TaxID=179855 RepID=A0A9P6JM12_9AGAR|nr:hypothetical protein CPB83DRAFT_859806 [Crepidotus variabilis]